MTDAPDHVVRALRAVDEAAMYEAPASTKALLDRAADLIEALSRPSHEVTEDTMRAALEWIADIADKTYEQDEKLRSNGARALMRISDRARAALSPPTKEGT